MRKSTGTLAGAVVLGLMMPLMMPMMVLAADAAPVLKAPTSSAKIAKAQASAKAAHLQALNQAMNGDLKGGIRALAVLSSKSMTGFERDRVFMSLGRLQYEAGQFNAAINSYEKVSRAGSSWLESLEETAWAELRAGRPEETIARLKTVTSSVFKNDTRSEPYFLLGLAQLRVCDFKAVYKTLDLFKSRFGLVAKKLEPSKAGGDQARLKEIGDTVQKLNLVEAEVIQRLHIDEDGKRRSGSAPSIARSSDQLSFPASDDDEFWLDEVDGFKVSLKGCVKPQPIKLKTVASVKDVSKGEVTK